MLSKCPYSGKYTDRNLDYKDPSKSGDVLQICVKNLDDISIVLGEVSII